MTNALVALPKNGDVGSWSATEKALVEAAGLVSRGQLAPRPVVEAFLLQCQKTQLDPIARQIYCIERGGKWTTQISIDGARLVAERSKEYQGQTPVEWTSDGVNWLQVWLAKDPPAAARVGVYRAGFQAPLYAVATWDAYNAGSPIWKKMPALMLGKCAEMLALRKAFPMELSGLYSSEEMAQADAPRTEVQAAPSPREEPAPARGAARDWARLVNLVTDEQGLRSLFDQAGEEGELGLPLAAEHAESLAAVVQRFGLPTPPSAPTVQQLIMAIRPVLGEVLAREAADAEVVDAEVVDESGEPVTEWETAQIPGGGEES